MTLFTICLYLSIIVGVIICITNIKEENSFAIISTPILISLILFGTMLTCVVYLENEKAERLSSIKSLDYQLLNYKNSNIDDIENIHERISNECGSEVLFTDRNYNKVDNLIKADKVFCKKIYRNDEVEEISKEIELIEEKELKYHIDDILISYGYKNIGKSYNEKASLCEQKLFVDDLVSKVSEEPFSKYNFYIYCKSDDQVTRNKEDIDFNTYSVFKDIKLSDYQETRRLKLICEDIIYSNGSYYSESTLINTTEVLCKENR